MHWDHVGCHRLTCGRCEDVLGELDEGSVDVVCTSPPYNLGIVYPSSDDNLGEGAYLDWFGTVADLLWRALKPDGSFFLNLGGSNTRPWLPFRLPLYLRSRRWELQNHIVWVKSVTIGEDTTGQFKPITSKRYLNHTHEAVLHLTKTGKVPIDRLAVGVPYADKSNISRFGESGRSDLRCRGNTWFLPYETIQSREQKFNHPASFPITLPRWAIRLHGTQEPVVLDPFAGTGSTLVAAHLEGGCGIGVELDPGYHSAALTRLLALKGPSHERLDCAANLDRR